MIIELTDTNSAAIAGALAKVRRNLGPASGLVLTLVVVCDAAHYDEALTASLTAGREHPSRILVVVRSGAKTTKLDAQIRSGEGSPGDVVTLRLSGELTKHAESVVLPLLLPDLPVVVWWPTVSPAHPGEDPLGALATRRITDAAGEKDALAALAVRARNHQSGDTDLTWTRLTPWRALLAAALDQYPTQVTGVVVEADAKNAPAELMAAWLESRLRCPVTMTHTDGPGITGIRLQTAAGDIAVLRADGATATYQVPGQPKRTVALKRRTVNELLTEELRRMDADDIFEAACVALLARTEHERRSAAAKKAAATRRKAAAKK